MDRSGINPSLAHRWYAIELVHEAKVVGGGYVFAGTPFGALRSAELLFAAHNEVRLRSEEEGLDDPVAPIDQQPERAVA